jgi:hypothetical protein
MKIEVELNDTWVDGLIVKVLRQSVQRNREMGDDGEYCEQYAKAAEFVIEHFGGSLID